MINENNVNKENKLDITALAIFFPSVVALAIIPVLMHVSYVISDIPETARLFSSTEKDGSLYLPQWFLEEQGLKPGDRFAVSAGNGRIVLTKRGGKARRKGK